MQQTLERFFRLQVDLKQKCQEFEKKIVFGKVQIQLKKIQIRVKSHYEALTEEKNELYFWFVLKCGKS